MPPEGQNRLVDPLLGTIFADRYEILEVLGEGGMGTVYKARHRLMKRLVAIKMLHAHLNETALKRFQKEAESVSCLNHPNVVAVHDFGLSPRPYLVMDYLQGNSLADQLENHRRLNLDRSLRIFVQICEGLAHAHQRGILHRDLKPSNIMLETSDVQPDLVKIVDFGIAKLMSQDGDSKQLTLAGEVFGSPAYMSPEQCNGNPMDARSDIYSLGCIMYETLSGYPPIHGETFLECMFKHVNTMPPHFKDICPELNVPETVEALIEKSMAKDPENRFSSVLELKQTLEALQLELDPSVVAARDSIAREINRQPGTEPSSNEEVTTAGAESEFVAAAAESEFVAAAAESEFAAAAAESEFAAAAAESEFAAAAAESEFAAAAAESEFAAAAAESEFVAAAAEAKLAATAAEAEFAATAAESEFAATAAESEFAATATEAEFVASAAEASRAAAAEAIRAATAIESGLINSAIEAGRIASAAEAGRAAAAAETKRTASAAEAGRAAAAAEAGRAAAAAETKRTASAAEVGRLASAAEAERSTHAAESKRSASDAEAKRVSSAGQSERAAAESETLRAASAAQARHAASEKEAARVISAAHAKEDHTAS